MIGNGGSALSLLMIPLAPVLPTVVAQVLERNRDESEAIALCLKKKENLDSLRVWILFLAFFYGFIE